MFGLFKRRGTYRLFYRDEDGYPVQLRIRTRAKLDKALKRCAQTGCTGARVEKRYTD